ncbi:hypothetical protein AB7M49_000858 [Bradyrhizobium elkanii]|nr:hypothetical protein [Bradyrhizobium elkanii]MCS3523107.1 hypothetical protein [Bradyrhizobium elkanii]MCS4070760.1 hypothetical protein [Bradyrhizobium elkanii]MCS4077391.1 hypothetical protein [Bradyrhizobium elkanii]MCS4111556.1 hypothetical protein [Bradyrhizobium elkanii]
MFQWWDFRGSKLCWCQRSPGHKVEGGFMAEILVVRSTTRWLRLNG